MGNEKDIKDLKSRQTWLDNLLDANLVMKHKNIIIILMLVLNIFLMWSLVSNTSKILSRSSYYYYETKDEIYDLKRGVLDLNSNTDYWIDETKDDILAELKKIKSDVYDVSKIVDDIEDDIRNNTALIIKEIRK